MSNISYEILYVPNLPLKQEPFEYLDGTGDFKIRFEMSVGNNISDFNSGFIRIKNSKTENNILSSKYEEQVIPFSNKKYGYNKSIIEKEKINIPIVRQDNQGYYIQLPKKIFGENLLTSQTNIKDMILNQNLSIQIALTKDVISAGYENTSGDKNFTLNRDGTGQGKILNFNMEKQKWELVSFTEYFNGDILAKGISSWSATSTLNVLTETRYTLVYPENKKKLESINSPIVEFNGIRINNTPIDCVELNLKKFKIEIYDDELENKQLIDSSDWIKSDGINELNIIWQNKKELYDKHNYLIRLTICNYFDFYKKFDFHLKTIFQDSEFKANFKVKCNHDLARNELELKIKSPLYWGPDTNISLGLGSNEYADVNNEGIKIEQGINLVPNQGSWSGEFIFSNITPIDNWEQQGDDYFLKIQTSEPNNKNPYQFMYCLYALSTPTSFDVNYKKDVSQFSPYEEDILWNPVLQSYDNNSIQFQLFLDSSDDLYDSNDIDTLKNNRVLTLGYSKTEKQPTNNVLYVRQHDPVEGFINKWWEVMINSNGEVKLQEASTGIGKEFTPKPIYLYDPIKHLITEMGVEFKDAEKTGLGHDYKTDIVNPNDYRIFFDNELRSFIPGRTKRPTYINEFRLVKRVFNYSSGIKTEIENQTYRAYLTGPNQKLMNWNLIDPSRQYYFHIRERKGQIQLSVADITKDNKEKLDRYNALSNGSSIGLLNDQILNMRGLDGNTYMIQRKSDGTPLYYNLSIDAMGIPNVDFGSLSSITITYEPLLNEDKGLSSDIIQSTTKDDFIDFDEIIADVVIDKETFLKDYHFKSFSENNRPYYMQPLKDFAEKIEKEKFENDNEVILFLTDQHYQEHRADERKGVVELYSKQYDAIDCVLELSNMTKIDAIILGGDNIDGCGWKRRAKESINTISQKIIKNKNPYTKIGLVQGNHDYNTVGATYGNLMKDEKGEIVPSKFYNEVYLRRSEYNYFIEDSVKRYDSGCGFFIQNNTLYLLINSSDCSPKFDEKNNLIINPLFFYGYTTEQLNDISKILCEQGSKVSNIIISSHIPFNYKDEKYIEKNINLLEEVLSDYHKGLKNTYYTNKNGETEIKNKIPFENLHHAKITLSLHGHTYKEEFFKKNGINGFTANAALNAKKDEKYGWIQRVNDNTENMTCFKAIIYSQKQKMYKILNFGYSNENTLDNFIMEV